MSLLSTLEEKITGKSDSSSMHFSPPRTIGQYFCWDQMPFLFSDHDFSNPVCILFSDSHCIQVFVLPSPRKKWSENGGHKLKACQQVFRVLTAPLFISGAASRPLTLGWNCRSQRDVSLGRQRLAARMNFHLYPDHRDSEPGAGTHRSSLGG